MLGSEIPPEGAAQCVDLPGVSLTWGCHRARAHPEVPSAQKWLRPQHCTWGCCSSHSTSKNNISQTHFISYLPFLCV